MHCNSAWEQDTWQTTANYSSCICDILPL